MNKKLRDKMVNEVVEGALDVMSPIILKAIKKANGSHYTVYGELIKAMKESYKKNELAELEFKGVGVQYEGISIDDNGLGDSVVTLYRTIGHENIEVATILLSGDKEYRVSNPSTFWPELIELQD